MMVQEFGEIGLGQAFRYLTGLLKITGGLLLIRPKTLTSGGVLLMLASLRAGTAQIAVLHRDVTQTVVFAATLDLVAYAYRGVRA